MREGRLIERSAELPVDAVHLGTRLRPVTEAGVAALRQSYQNLGVIKDAIQVRQKKSGEFFLIAGAHRLTLAQEEGWSTIRSDVWDCTQDWAQMMEVDDNLAGADLVPLDRALFLVERKRLYEKIYPESRAGVAGAAARWNASAILSFASATAEVLGCSKRSVERMVAGGASLSSDQVRWLRAAPRPVLGGDLEVLAKISDDHERSQVCIALSNGDAKSAAQARASFAAKTGAGPAPKDPVEEALKALSTAWARAPMAARRRFIEEANVELFALLRDLDGGLAE